MKLYPVKTTNSGQEKYISQNECDEHCWVFAGYLLGICWVFAGYLLGICWDVGVSIIRSVFCTLYHERGYFVDTIRGLPFHSQGGVRVFLEKKNCTLIFEERKNCTLIFK